MKKLTPIFLILIFAVSTFATVLVEAPNLFVEQDEEFSIAINGVYVNGVIAGQFDLNYDSNIIEPVSGEDFCTTEGTAAEGFLLAVCNGYDPGTVHLVLYGPYPLTFDDGEIVIFRFRTIGYGTSPLKFNAGHFFRLVPYGETSSEYSNGSVTVSASKKGAGL